MDAGIQDEEGYISVMSRTDDDINVAGHRLSCGHMEEVSRKILHYTLGITPKCITSGGPFSAA